MSGYGDLARALLDLAARGPADQPEGDLAYLGFKPAGGAYAIKVSGRPNWVWVRLEHGNTRAPVQAFNKAQVRRIPGCPVRVKTLNGSLHVTGYDAASIATFLGNTPLDSAEPGMGAVEPVSTRRIKAGLVRCYKVSGSYGLSVYVEPFAYTYNGESAYWPGGALDVSGYLPSSTGMQGWIKVGHDPAANALGAAAGTEQSPLVPLARADLDALALPGYVPLAGIKATAGQTAFDDERTITDLRPWWIGLGTPFDLVKHHLAATSAPTASDDSADGYGVGSWWLDTAARQAYTCMDATAGAAVWTALGGSGVTSDFDVDALPAIPSALDDEFTGSSLDAKWTEFDPDGVQTVTESGGVLVLSQATQSSDKPTGVRQALPAGDFTVAAKLKMSPAMGDHTGQAWGVGIGLWEDAADPTGDLTILGIAGEQPASVGTWGFGSVQFTASYGGNRSLALAGTPAVDTYFYIRVRRTGSTLMLDHSTDGLSWTSEDVTARVPSSIGHIGLAMVNVATAVTLVFTSAFFRYRATYDGASDPVYGSVPGTLAIQEQDGTPSVSGVRGIKVPNGTLTDEGEGVVALALPAPLTVEESDGAPSISDVTTIKVSPGTLTDLGSGVVQINTGAAASLSYYAKLAALLEPGCVLPMQVDTFSYVVGPTSTIYALATWSTRLGSTGRWEVRDPHDPFPLRGVTLVGTASGATAILLDPSLVTYADAEATYFDRLNQLDEMQTRQVDLTAPSTVYPLLPGPYGSVITSVVNFDYTWIVGQLGGRGWNLDNEIGDGAGDFQRNYNRLALVVTKDVMNRVRSGVNGTGKTGIGTVTYVLLPSTWGEIADPNTYDFRDDFMAAALDTATTWNRTQSSAGKVEIDTAFAWLKLSGNGSWGANGAFSQASVARAAGQVVLADVFIPYGATPPNLIVGWHDGAGYSYSDFAHGVDFTTSGSNAIQIFEDGTSRGTVGSGWTAGNTYRVRITLTETGATYEIQGGPEYAALGGATWTDITPGTTSSSTTPVHAGVTISTNQDVWVGDVRVY